MNNFRTYGKVVTDIESVNIGVDCMESNGDNGCGYWLGSDNVRSCVVGDKLTNNLFNLVSLVLKLLDLFNPRNLSKEFISNLLGYFFLNRVDYIAFKRLAF